MHCSGSYNSVSKTIDSCETEKWAMAKKRFRITDIDDNFPIVIRRCQVNNLFFCYVQDQSVQERLLELRLIILIDIIDMLLLS